MSSITAIAGSGLSAAMLAMDTAAHNLANLQTPGFRRQQVVQAEQAGGGVEATTVRAAASGDALADDMVHEQIAAYSFKANLLTLKTGQKMLGTLLDIAA